MLHNRHINLRLINISLIIIHTWFDWLNSLHTFSKIIRVPIIFLVCQYLLTFTCKPRLKYIELIFKLTYLLTPHEGSSYMDIRHSNLNSSLQYNILNYDFVMERFYIWKSSWEIHFFLNVITRLLINVVTNLLLPSWVKFLFNVEWLWIWTFYNLQNGRG